MVKVFSRQTVRVPGMNTGPEQPLFVVRGDQMDRVVRLLLTLMIACHRTPCAWMMLITPVTGLSIPGPRHMTGLLVSAALYKESENKISSNYKDPVCTYTVSNQLMILLQYCKKLRKTLCICSLFSQKDAFKLNP